MLSLDQAIASALLRRKEDDPDVDWVIENVVEFSEGWFIYLNSRKYLETRNLLDRPIGPGPLIVGKETGLVFQAGPAMNKEYWISRFLEYMKSQK